MNKHKTLDEIKEKYTNPPIAEKIDGIDYALIDLADLEWLIKQAERVQELKEENKRQREALEEIEEHAVWGMFTNKYVIMARKGLGLLKEESE